MLLYSKCRTHGYCHCGEECQCPTSLTASAAQSVEAEDVATCELFLVFDALADTLFDLLVVFEPNLFLFSYR